MNKFFHFKKYLSYLLKAKTKYYLHSPFVYQFYLNVLEGESDKTINSLQSLRKALMKNTTILNIGELGTGKLLKRTIADIESKVSVRHKYGVLLYRMVKYFQPENILEIGTSIGLSSSYMALGNIDARIISLEGSVDISEVAAQNHALLQIKNVEIIIGNFNHTLVPSIQRFQTINFIFFDGNHTKKATLHYFHQCLEKANENSIFVFDDICWNTEMNEAWEQIKQHPQITVTIDVYQFGICFFRKEKLAKENFVLWY